MLPVSDLLEIVTTQKDGNSVSSNAPQRFSAVGTASPVIIWNVCGHCNMTCPHCYAVATKAPEEPRDRVSLTLPVLNNARQVVFLAFGRDKAEPLSWMVQELFRGNQTVLPAARVRPTEGKLLWLVDKAATPFLRKRGKKS